MAHFSICLMLVAVVAAVPPELKPVAAHPKASGHLSPKDAPAVGHEVLKALSTPPKSVPKDVPAQVATPAKSVPKDVPAQVSTPAKSVPKDAPAKIAPASKNAPVRPVHLAAEKRQAAEANATAEQIMGAGTSTPRSQTFRICNAHPKGGNLVAFLDDGDSMHTELTEGQPIAFKSCRDFTKTVSTGDFVELRTPASRSPIFLPTAPVSDGSVGLIVMYDKAGKAGVWLHYFDHLVNPQIAAFDVSGGTAPLDAACVSGSCTLGEHQQLQMSGVAPVNPGNYAIKAGGANVELNAAPGATYAVLLLGPNEAFVYPPPTPTAAYSGAAGLWSLSAVLVALTAVVL